MVDLNLDNPKLLVVHLFSDLLLNVLIHHAPEKLM